MADIRVQRKEGVPVWAWIVGLLVLGLVIWAIASMVGRDDRAAVLPADTVAVAPAAHPTELPAEAQSFVRECHVEEGTRTEDMGLEHEFTIRCFEQMAGALDAVARQRTPAANIDQYTQVMRQRADQIRESGPESIQHAQWSREAAEAGANALESLQQTWAPGDQQLHTEITRVRDSAQQISGDDLHLEQLTHLRSYFRGAADALNRLAAQPVA